jgi:hypothetical protein
MKRILAGLALASSAAFMTAAPAQAAAPADPVKALKKQYAAGHGVRVSETSRTTVYGRAAGPTTTTGAFGFDKSGIVSADLRTRAKGHGATLNPPRMVTVGKYVYAQGGLFSEELPEGKKWVRYQNDAGRPTTGAQVIDIFEPKVLKAIVSKAKSFKGGTYRGAITFGDLSKIYSQKIDKRLGKVKISYALGVNSKGLVTGVRSEYTMDFGLLGKTTSTVSTRYTGWGAKITIKAPPADQVIDVSELGADTEVPQEIPDGSLNSLAGVK